MKLYAGKPQENCQCLLCTCIRAHQRDAFEHDPAQADTLPPTTPVKTADELLAEIKSALAGGVW